MDSLLPSSRCDSCGTNHHFCLCGDSISRGRRYGYLCPVSGQKAQLRPDSDGDPLPHAPQGAVQLHLLAESPDDALTRFETT